jgi:glycosyltransferase involved in cell wall biosynthesis
MKVLVFHGYLLTGTGSNVYTASLAHALAALGHEVHLVCQERSRPDLAAGTPGSVTIHNPDIGGLLPVFVRDDYEGFEVKTFSELSDEELDRYLEANVTAVRELVDSVGGVDAVIANHVVMGPVICARAGLRYALAVHGSDLSYTILPEPERFVPYAREAVEEANGILVGSGHIAARLRQAIDEPATNAKVRLGPPGVDTELFAPIPEPERQARLEALVAQLRALGGPQGGGGSWDRDPGKAADAVEWFAAPDGPRVIFVGKLIVSKGVDLLLAAWPLVVERHPGARLLLVGFGAGERPFRAVAEGFATGDVRPLATLAEHGRGLEGGQPGRLSMLSAFLEDAPENYAQLAQAAAGSIGFAGRLEHAEVATPVACSQALVFPSTFPEAFGMVAAEAAAAGVLPVSAHHSGAAEVSAALAANLPESARDLVSFDLAPNTGLAIAERLNGWFGLAEADRVAASRALRETTERLWSWREVARSALAASAGELDRLRVPVED